METPAMQGVRSWFVPLGIVIIAGLLITIITLQVRSQDQQNLGAATVVTQEPADLSYIESRDPEDLQAAGPIDAPVGLVVYSDYQCPFCGKWTADTLPTMMEYAEQGDLRIEWRDVNQYGENSERAARAANAAARQGEYWLYHQGLFPGGAHRSADQLTTESLIALAEELGLDPQQFAEDLESTEVADEVELYAAQGREIGVSGTPSFVLGGVPIVGAQPTHVFVNTLREALAK